MPESISGARNPELYEKGALVKSSADEREGEDLCARSSPLTRIPIEIDVAVPVRGFRVANLLALEKNHVIASQWQQGEDLPLGSRGAQLAWAEFEVIDDKLAVRITRLV